MPELPEVETVMRGLEKPLKGQRIKSADVRREGLRVPFTPGLAKKLAGRTIQNFSRRAKYILMTLDNDDVLVMHLGMSGRVVLMGGDEDFTPGKHDHFILNMEDGARAVLNDARRFGSVILLKSTEVETHKVFAALGPEPLGNHFHAEYLLEKFAGRSAPVKLSIMDQGIVVGVGNIYACEALYDAGIDPQRAAGSIKPGEAEKLVVAIRDVLNRAISAGGSSLRDYRQADGELGYFQHEFRAYGREGHACPQCGDKSLKKGGILRISQGGRSTFFCPLHQK